MDDFYDGPFVFTGATEDQQRWERARPSLERNGLTSREHGLGIASYETGHTVIIPWNHDQRQWKMTILHGDHPVHTKGISVSLGQGDESVGDRAMAHLRRPDVMQSMRDQMDPATDDDGSWPRRF